MLVRDGNYLKKIINKKKDFDNIRNSEINDFINGIKYLEKKGYTIFRMGKHAHKRMAYTSPNVIDYPFSKIKSDFMDLFLIKKCKFFISTGAGLDSIACVLNKPQLFINFAPMLTFMLLAENFLWTFKKIYSTKNKRYLTFSEMFKYNMTGHNNFKVDPIQILKVYKEKIKYIDIGNLEIKNAIADMEKFCLNKSLTKIQRQFRKKFSHVTGRKQDFAPIVSDSFLKHNRQLLI